MKFAKRISILALASLIICTNFTYTANADTNIESTTNLTVNVRASITKERAKQIMLNKVPGGILVEFSYDYDDGVGIYEGKIISGNYEYEIEVSARNGAILKFERDYRDYDDGYINIGNSNQNTNTGNTNQNINAGNTNQNTNTGNIGSNVNKNLIGEAKSREIMLSKVPNGKIIYVYMEYDDGIPVYEGKMVKGNKEYEISINGYTGAILDFESEYRYDYSNTSSSSSNTNLNLIGEAKAKEIMLNKVPGATIKNFCLDLDDRIPEYKGKLVKGYREYEVSVHAITGAIIDYSSEVLDDVLGHWAEDTIFDFYKNGYINGYSDNSFNPNGKITRAEFVKILNKYFNLSKTSGITFNDVSSSHWAKNEIDIAVTNGICKGVSSTEFAPDVPITREQAAVMIANYLNIKDTNYDKLSKFNDKNNVSSWAKSSIEALLERGYLTGTSSTTLSAKNNTTRAESVTLLSRIK